MNEDNVDKGKYTEMPTACALARNTFYEAAPLLRMVQAWGCFQLGLPNRVPSGISPFGATSEQTTHHRAQPIHRVDHTPRPNRALLAWTTLLHHNCTTPPTCFFMKELRRSRNGTPNLLRSRCNAICDFVNAGGRMDRPDALKSAVLSTKNKLVDVKPDAS